MGNEVTRRSFMNSVAVGAAAMTAGQAGYFAGPRSANAAFKAKGNVPDKPFKTGHITFLTGPANLLGEPGRKGHLMAAEEINAELSQTLIRGLGERHLEIIVGRLARKYGVHANVGKPKVAYRETLKGKAEGQGKHKKQTGGRGQYGDCWIRVAPLPLGPGFPF